MHTLVIGPGGQMKDLLSVAREAALKAGGILRDNIHGIREITV